VARYHIRLPDGTGLRLDLYDAVEPEREVSGDQPRIYVRRVTLDCFLVFKNGEVAKIDRAYAERLFATSKAAVKEDGTPRTLTEVLQHRYS
jgi:hypothetical protein